MKGLARGKCLASLDFKEKTTTSRISRELSKSCYVECRCVFMCNLEKTNVEKKARFLDSSINSIQSLGGLKGNLQYPGYLD